MITTIAELELFYHWDEQPDVTAADPNDDWNWDVELDGCLGWRELCDAFVIPVLGMPPFKLGRF
ncbi:MAG TPA: hypothetical protein VF181_11185 [Balneolaceae bacterium]